MPILNDTRLELVKCAQALCSGSVKKCALTFSALHVYERRLDGNVARAAMWHTVGFAIKQIADELSVTTTDARWTIARYCWQRSASLLDYCASSFALVEQRCASLRALHESLMTEPFTQLCAATRVRTQHNDDAQWLAGVMELSESDSLPQDMSSVPDSIDMHEQVERCRALIDRLRIGALELYCSWEAGCFDGLLAAELSAVLNVALIKCRSVLTDHAFTRFARRYVWAAADGKSMSEHARLGIFQAQLRSATTLGDLADSLKSVLSIGCKAEKQRSDLVQLLQESLGRAIDKDCAHIVNSCASVGRFIAAVNAVAKKKRDDLSTWLAKFNKGEEQRELHGTQTKQSLRKQANNMTKLRSQFVDVSESNLRSCDPDVLNMLNMRDWSWDEVCRWQPALTEQEFVKEMKDAFARTTEAQWLVLAQHCTLPWLARLINVSNSAKHCGGPLLMRDEFETWFKQCTDFKSVDDLLPLRIFNESNGAGCVRGTAFLVECTEHTNAIVRGLLGEVDSAPRLANATLPSTSPILSSLTTTKAPLTAAHVACSSSSSTSSLFTRVAHEERQLIYTTLQSIADLNVAQPKQTITQIGSRKDWIDRFGDLQLEDVGGNGDCQFRTLAALIFNDPEKFQLVRQEIARFMRTNREDFKEAHWDSASRKKDNEGNSISKFHALDEYCSALENDKEWGTFHTLRAASMLYNCAIQVLSSSHGGCKFPLIGATTDQHSVPLVIAHYDEFHFVLVRAKNK